MSLWTTITEPQAMILSALLTIVAAAVGVFFGSWLFGNRVADLKEALAQAEKQLTEYRGQFDETVQQMGRSLDVQVQAIQQSLGQIGNAIEDVRASTDDDRADVDQLVDGSTRLRESWITIRDHLEEIASSPEIDGRTRARYTRIDRRRFRDFVQALANDGRLGSDEQRYFTALEIWMRNRRGSRSPTNADVEAMQQIALDVVRR